MRLVTRSAVLVIACLLGSSVGQQKLASDTTAFRSAAHVFSGTVRNISGQGGAILITVHIDDAIKGTTEDTDFQWREWEGAWRAGARYRTGERLVIFLRAAGANGLTSPLQVLRIEGEKVRIQRHSARLGASQAAVPYRDYVRALRAVQ